jgi:hypothetical protein
MADELDRVVNETGMERRTFMRRLITGTVFAAPVVASFAMGGIDAASASAAPPVAPCVNTNTTQLEPAPVLNYNQPESFIERDLEKLERLLFNANSSPFGGFFPH